MTNLLVKELPVGSKPFDKKLDTRITTNYYGIKIFAMRVLKGLSVIPPHLHHVPLRDIMIPKTEQYKKGDGYYTDEYGNLYLAEFEEKEFFDTTNRPIKTVDTLYRKLLGDSAWRELYLRSFSGDVAAIVTREIMERHVKDLFLKNTKYTKDEQYIPIPIEELSFITLDKPVEEMGIYTYNEIVKDRIIKKAMFGTR